MDIGDETKKSNMLANRATAYRKIGFSEKAIEDLNRSIELN